MSSDRILALAASLCLAAPAFAGIPIVPFHPEDGNMVPNPHFDTFVGGLGGWTESPTHPPYAADLQPSCDFEDQVGSNGVLLVVNEYGYGELLACVPIQGGGEYDLGIWAKLPLDGPAGAAGFHLNWMADAGCTQLLQDVTTFGANAATPGSEFWKRYHETYVAPAEARALQVGLQASKSDADPTAFKACLDEPFVLPEPSAPGLAALAALGVCRRRHR